MAKLLNTKLPIAFGEVNPDVYNRMVRTVELSLNSFDPTSTPQYTQAIRNQNEFEQGDIIWNLTLQELQLWNGEQWIILYEGEQFGVEGVASLGKITVSTGGATTITI